jgi:hypothetical protein
MQPAFNTGMLREQVPGPGEGIGCRLMSGEEEREHFVTHLLLAHPLSRFLVLRLKEH